MDRRFCTPLITERVERIEGRIWHSENLAEHGPVEVHASIIAVGLVRGQEVSQAETALDLFAFSELCGIEAADVQDRNLFDASDGEVGASVLLTRGDPPTRKQPHSGIAP